MIVLCWYFSFYYHGFSVHLHVSIVLLQLSFIECFYCLMVGFQKNCIGCKVGLHVFIVFCVLWCFRCNDNISCIFMKLSIPVVMQRFKVYFFQLNSTFRVGKCSYIWMLGVLKVYFNLILQLLPYLFGSLLHPSQLLYHSCFISYYYIS